MAEVVDPSLLKELCLKHKVPLKLAQRIVSEFLTVETPKKNYLEEIIEGWESYVDKKTGS